MRKKYSPKFKAKVAIDAIRDSSTMSILSSRYEVNRVMIQRWKNKAVSGIADVFSNKSSKKMKKNEELISAFYSQIGQLTCELFGLSKGALQYEANPMDPYSLELMDLIDAQYMKTPFYGHRRMTAYLNSNGHKEA